MSGLIEKVLHLRELLIARATDSYEKGASEAFKELRKELLIKKTFMDIFHLLLKIQIP